MGSSSKYWSDETDTHITHHSGHITCKNEKCHNYWKPNKLRPKRCPDCKHILDYGSERYVCKNCNTPFRLKDTKNKCPICGGEEWVKD